MLFFLDTRPRVQTDFSNQRDFLTSDEELPAAVRLTIDGPRDAATYFTEVKTETTDDN
jgi:hypothetical protein